MALIFLKYGETKMDYDDNQKELHVLFMKEILLSINLKNYPTYLKGGTALLLCYELDRFSEDIDLDSEKSFNLETTIKEASQKLGIVIDRINIPKDTETTKRYKIHYNKDMYPNKDMYLKIETSFRNKINNNDVSVINGIKVYNPEIILGMKFSAIDGDSHGRGGRIKARDLHDIIFLAKNYASLFSKEQINRFLSLSEDIDKILSFEDDYNEDSILGGQFEKDVDELEKQAEKLKHLKDQKETNKIESILQKENEKQTKKIKRVHPPRKFRP